jgi:hypothetical protein
MQNKITGTTITNEVGGIADVAFVMSKVTKAVAEVA